MKRASSSEETREVGSEGSGELATIAQKIKHRFDSDQSVLTFAEYLEQFRLRPSLLARDASHYLRDVFDFYGEVPVQYPSGQHRRFKLFDLPWRGQGGPPFVPGLIGQEPLQEALYRNLVGFCDRGRPNRLIMMHGPNGSGKSLAVACIVEALEQYSTTPEGALYRFQWVFDGRDRSAYAAADDEALPDAALPRVPTHARITADLCDHPLFLIPSRERADLISKSFGATGAKDIPNDWILRGQLSRRSEQIFRSLLTAYDGSFLKVLQHVQVERYYISKRYRTGAAIVGPDVSVDMGERQLTSGIDADGLPKAVRDLLLFETFGELVEASGGVLEFSDLLKRPLDAFKYLQISLETNEVNLQRQTVHLNCVMIASANEIHLGAFREHVEYLSFMGRMELVRAPYLRNWLQERGLYDEFVSSQESARHVAPHATSVAAQFAVLTRMRKPMAERYPETVRSLITQLTPFDKMGLYAGSLVPERFSIADQNVLRGAIGALYTESDLYPIYEGSVGASPREIMAALAAATQGTYSRRCVSPLDVMDQIDTLRQRRNDFDWMAQEAIPGGYHDLQLFVATLRDWLFTVWREELLLAAGIIDEGRPKQMLKAYIDALEANGGRVGQSDDQMDVQQLLGVDGEPAEWIQYVADIRATWAVDNPGRAMDIDGMFARELRKLRLSLVPNLDQSVRECARKVVILARAGGAGLDSNSIADAEATIEQMIARFGYCRSCAVDVVSAVLERSSSTSIL